MRKPLVFMDGRIEAPPFTVKGRRECGFYLGLLQDGNSLSLPISRPMPTIGPGCHELRIKDEAHYWRAVYHVADEAVVILAVFPKQTSKTPPDIIKRAKRNLAAFEETT